MSHTLQIALQALLRNKMRSFLTMLGIIIGVFAVIAMVAVGDGATARVQGLFASIGTNMLIVLPGASQQGGAFGGFGTQPTLTWDDLKAMRDGSAHGALRRGDAAQSRCRCRARITTGTPASTELRPIISPFAIGPSSRARCSRKPIWMARPRPRSLGQTVVEKLFGANFNPVGQTIRINNVPFVGDRRARIQGPIDARPG